MAHGPPQGECLFCVEEMDETNYAEYSDGGEWKPSPYCSSCLEAYFIGQQWQKYLDSIHKADCAAALRRVIAKPPPLYVIDKGFASDENPRGEVKQFWFSTGGVRDAKLVGALEGEERDAFWAEKQSLLTALEASETDEEQAQ